MASANLYDFKGDLKGKVDLPDSIFGAPMNRAVLYDAVRMYNANTRTGSAKAKGRSEIRFSNAKPYRQKGTGRARAGRRSSPIWRGGGVVFGPKPRNYGFSMPKKVRRMALKSALSDKGCDDNVVVLEGVTIEAPKTRPFVEFLEAAGLAGRNVLFVWEHFDENVFMSTRNIRGAAFILAGDINALEILKADTLVMTKEALSRIEEVFA